MPRASRRWERHRSGACGFTRTSGSAPTVPKEVDGERSQCRCAVATPGDGVEAQPAVRGRDERLDSLVEGFLAAPPEAIRFVRRNGAANGRPGGRFGLVAEVSGQGQELLERGVAGEGGGPGVGQQVGPLQGCELGEVLGQCRPVRWVS